MRDYSFGNFISAIRERRGLSQYQLGALVGVTDKAVSKWENGASKPRMGAMRKLAEVLDVSVDELLTCEYSTFEEKRKDLFAMKNEIIEKAKQKMTDLYGEHPPICIRNRFQTEVLMLDGQQALLWMGFMGRLSEEAKKKNFYCEERYPQISASFVAWLLGGTIVNPLPSHYYCPKCKKIEFISEHKFGMDAPDKQCSCGEAFRKDGFGIDVMNLYPFCTGNEIYVTNGGIEHTFPCMKEYFEGYGVVRELQITDDLQPCGDENEADIFMRKYALLSYDMAKKYDDVIRISVEEYCHSREELSIITIIENRSDKNGNRDLASIMFSPEQIKNYTKSVLHNEIVHYPIPLPDLEDLANNLENPTFEDVVFIRALSKGTGVWTNNGDNLIRKGIPLRDLITCREDVYDFVYEKLKGKCCDNPSGQVYEIKEHVRKGIYHRKGMPKDIECLLIECDVPKWYIESMKKILYLFPKTTIITHLKREIYDAVKNFQI